MAQARLGVRQEEHERFFREQLGDIEEGTLPYGVGEVHGDGSRIEEVQEMVEEGQGERMRERARKLGVSTASLCHVAWGQVVAKLSGREDVVFGTVVFGRMQGGRGADRAMGPFLNTLPVRIGVGRKERKRVCGEHTSSWRS